jgi:glycerophosphoryl diester phosphodiesterase
LGSVSCESNTSDPSDLKASFSFQQEELILGTEIDFINESSGTTSNTVYLWDFGDGSHSAEPNPSHIYVEFEDGSFEVSLTLVDEGHEAVVRDDISLKLNPEIEGRQSLIEKLSDGKMLVCAHRGHHKKSPENSILAVTDAILDSIDMIEIDIRQTQDGQLVLMHDKTIDRTTNGSGDVGSYSLDELKNFRLYDDNGLLTNAQIPSLKEVLLLARGKLYIDLDVSKKASFEAVYRLTEQYGMLKQVLFYSSNLTVIKNMVNTDEDVVAMPIIDGESRFADYESLDLEVVHYTNATFNDLFIGKAKDKGWHIFMNAYVNSTSTPTDDNYGFIDKLDAQRVSIVQTDHPVLVNKYLNK